MIQEQDRKKVTPFLGIGRQLRDQRHAWIIHFSRPGSLPLVWLQWPQAWKPQFWNHRAKAQWSKKDPSSRGFGTRLRL